MEKQRPKEGAKRAQDVPEPAPQADPERAFAHFSRMLPIGAARVIGGQ